MTTNVNSKSQTIHQAYCSLQFIFGHGLLFLFVNNVLRRSKIRAKIELKSPKVRMMKAARVLSMLTGLMAELTLQGIGTFSAICQ